MKDTTKEAATLAALEAAGWSQTRAAEVLGISVTTLAARVYRSPALLEAWRANAARSGRSGRPPSHAGLSLQAVRDALQEHGTHAGAGRALGVSYQAISGWVARYPDALGEWAR